MGVTPEQRVSRRAAHVVRSMFGGSSGRHVNDRRTSTPHGGHGVRHGHRCRGGCVEGASRHSRHEVLPSLKIKQSQNPRTFTG